MAIARGWARLREAAVVAATSAAFTDATKKLDMTEAYAVDLQLQVGTVSKKNSPRKRSRESGNGKFLTEEISL